jgi:hypothetical protein
MISIALILILKELKPEKESKAFNGLPYLNAPYFGCETPWISIALVLQMVYKLNGFHLLRDASQQSTQGGLNFIERVNKAICI